MFAKSAFYSFLRDYIPGVGLKFSLLSLFLHLFFLNGGGSKKKLLNKEQKIHSSSEERASSACSANTSAMNPSRVPTARWPLKPGVLVHINRAHNLRNGLTSTRENGAIRNNRHLHQSQLHEEATTILKSPVRPFRRKDALSFQNEEGVLARANRIRAMFGSQLKSHDTFPGISRDKTGIFLVVTSSFASSSFKNKKKCKISSKVVGLRFAFILFALAVTYKKIAPPRCQTTPPDSLNSCASRKRKRPGGGTYIQTNNYYYYYYSLEQ